jgi:acyl carrier protein
MAPISGETPSILAQVQALLQSHFGLAAESVQPGAALADLGIDSLSAIEFVFELEGHFNISLSDGRADLTTVADLVAVVEHALGEANGPT